MSKEKTSGTTKRRCAEHHFRNQSKRFTSSVVCTSHPKHEKQKTNCVHLQHRLLHRGLTCRLKFKDSNAKSY